MFNLYKKYEEIIKYLFFGVLTTLVSILSYALFTRLFSINYLISNVLSWILAVLFAFITNKLYVFKSETTNIFKELIKFFEFRILSLLIESVIMYLFVDVLNLNDMIIKIIAQGVVIVLNYVFSKVFVFQSKKN